MAEEGEKYKLANQADETNVWPPWPWPPWGGDDDDDDDDDDGDHKPNRTEKAHELSIKVLEFESKLAAASLDL